MTNSHQTISGRAVLRLTGEDKRSFLQNLITQDINRLSPDNAIFAALLTPQGKILFDFIIAESGDTFFIDCNKDTADGLVKRLMLYKLRARIDIELDDTLKVSAATDASTSANTVIYADPRLAALGSRLIAPQRDVGDSFDFDARRIALGVPEFGTDFGANETFLLDVNYDALNGVSYKKGCFIGQEVTSRMKRKGEVRKRTLIAEFDGPAPAKGAVIEAGGSTLGEISSSSESRALALIRLDRWEKAQTAGAAALCEGRALRLVLPDYLEKR